MSRWRSRVLLSVAIVLFACSGSDEAEPPHGPWECKGGESSDLNEGARVTKQACAGMSCSYDGRPVGSSEKGGVLCCRD